VLEQRPDLQELRTCEVRAQRRARVEGRPRRSDPGKVG
jgi:hypothetical protein